MLLFRNKTIIQKKKKEIVEIKKNRGEEGKEEKHLTQVPGRGNKKGGRREENKLPFGIIHTYSE